MQENEPKKGRGCFFYGCLTLVFIGIGVTAGIYLGTRQAIKMAAERYTSAAPAEVPKLEISEAERKAILEGLQAQVAALKAGQAVPAISLGEKELNALLGGAKDYSTYQAQLYLKPEGDQLKSLMSVPLGQFPLWNSVMRKMLIRGMENRYFNGTAVLNASITNGLAGLGIGGLVVNSNALPAEFVSKLAGANFAEKLNENAEVRAVLEKAESLSVRDGRVELRFKQN